MPFLLCIFSFFSPIFSEGVSKRVFKGGSDDVSEGGFEGVSEGGFEGVSEEGSEGSLQISELMYFCVFIFFLNLLWVSYFVRDWGVFLDFFYKKIQSPGRGFY